MDPINNINQILRTFNIKATCVAHRQVENYSSYDLVMNDNGKVRDVKKYIDEIALALKATSKPNIKLLCTDGIVRLEFAGPRTNALKLFDYFTNNDVPVEGINCLLGQTTEGKRLWMDITQNPHLLISGTTGSGKSILLHNIIANLFNYNNVDLYLVDPKKIEFSAYEEKLNRTRTVYTYEGALQLLNELLEVMEMRYERMRLGNTQMKPIVVIIDEFADLILQDKEEQFFTVLCRLAQKSRAAKIHIILATQRPSVNIINGVIKANFPARIACRVASHVDSKVILDSSGAENLLGKGDALIRDNTHNLSRFQVAYTDANEVCSIFGA